MIFQQAANVVAEQLRRIPPVVHGEIDSIESSYAFTGGEPQITVACLQNRAYRILRQTAVCLPGLKSVLAQFSIGIQGVAAATRQKKE
jgi:hypothetical protein